MMKWVVRAVLEGICGLWANSIFWRFRPIPAFVTFRASRPSMAVVVNMRNSLLGVLIYGVIRWQAMYGRKSMFGMVKKDR